MRKELRGDRNQCPTCGDYFNSTAAFEKHRTGKIPDRRCLAADEMTEKGMVKNGAGFWVTQQNPIWATQGEA